MFTYDIRISRRIELHILNYNIELKINIISRLRVNKKATFQYVL